jgi:hypothetical protein
MPALMNWLRAFEQEGIMKFIILFFTILCISHPGNCVTITWVGMTGSNWNNTGNWMPSVIPGAGDDVIFNSSVTIEMDILSPSIYAINSLRVMDNAFVTLLRQQSGGGARILQVRSTDPLIKGLQVDANCTLLIHGINTSMVGSLEYVLDLGGAIGVTGEIRGELRFSGAGSLSPDNGTRLRLYTDAGNNASMLVKNGGAIRYYELTGNTGSSPGNYLIMENGSVYEIIKNGGSFPYGAWALNSLAKASGTGTIGPFFNGIDFGNLEWNCPLQSSISFLNKDINFNNVHLVNTNESDVNGEFRIKTGPSAGLYTMTIRGDLTLSPGARLAATSANTPVGLNGAIISVKGHINNNGTITTYGPAGTTSNFMISGSLPQNLSNSGIFSGNTLLFSMNNPSGLTLHSPLILPGNANLLYGKIKTTPANILCLKDNSTCAGGSSESFVDGPLQKTGDEGFLFPVGEGNEYAPIGISGSADPAETFIARYERGNPRIVFGPNYENPPINHMSVLEWWTLDRLVGINPRTVSLYARTYSNATQLSDLSILCWDGSLWQNEGNSAYAGISIGFVTSEVISNFSPGGTATAFTFGSRNAFTNPLPLRLLSIEVIRESKRHVNIKWQMAESCDSSIRFEVQKLIAGTFISIGTVSGNNQQKYSLKDDAVVNGLNLYRLKWTEPIGTTHYSHSIKIAMTEQEAAQLSLIKTIIDNEIKVHINSDFGSPVELILVDMRGNIIGRAKFQQARKGETIRMTVDRIFPGLYLLYGLSGHKVTNLLRVIKL